MENKNVDLFGNEIIKDVILRDKFIEPPFSVLDTKQGSWQNRKRQWKTLGIKSELGRVAKGSFGWQDLSTNPRAAESSQKIASGGDTASIFDPALCEVMYHWFCPKNGTILDPFAGGSVRGIVANKLGFKYTGIDIREEQIVSNYEQGKEILGDNCPRWICNDSNKELDLFDCSFDMVFSCPPYADLEVYSDLEGDISNKPYEVFLNMYESIINKSCKLLKSGGYGVFVVGEIRDKKGNYVGFINDTIQCFIKSGLNFYNEAILLNSINSASMRTKQFDISKKLVKIHQNVLIFKKP